MAEDQIRLENVSFGYREDHLVLKNINAAIAAGENAGIAGANGVGKSTFFRLLTGLETGFEGKIAVCGLDVNKKNINQVRQKAGYVFQDADSQMFLSTVWDNAAFGPSNYGLKGEELEERVEMALKATGIVHLARKPVYQLSGGEKKLAAIAAVLSMNPDILLLDEPSAALDPKNRRNLIELLNQLPQTKLIASHDLDFLLDTCGRTLLFYQGGIAADGKSSDILLDAGIMEDCGLELPLSALRR